MQYIEMLEIFNYFNIFPLPCAAAPQCTATSNGLEKGHAKFSLKRIDDPFLKPKMRPTTAAWLGPHTLTHQHERRQTTVAPARRCMPPFGRLHHWQPAGQPACVRLPLLLGLQTAAARA